NRLFRAGGGLIWHYGHFPTGLSPGAGLRALCGGRLFADKPAGGPPVRGSRPPPQIQSTDELAVERNPGMRHEIAVAPPWRVEWEEDGEVTTRGMLAITLRRLRRSHTAMVGLVIVCLLLLVALLADVLAPYSPIQTTPHNLWTPGWKHPLGTDLL